MCLKKKLLLKSGLLMILNCFITNFAFTQSLTIPSKLSADTSEFVLISNTGVTPAISGFSSDVQVIISSSSGLIKLGSISGLTPSTGYNSSLWLSGTNEIVFESTQANANFALQTLSYKNSGSSNGSISVTVNQTGAYYFNDRYYLYDSTIQSWDLHKANAESSTLGNCSGYLATITSQEEYNFVLDNISTNNGWLGGSDIDSEGTWKWVTGPEAGKTFYCDDTADSSCNVELNFHNFPEPSEPNNCCSGEHHLQQGFGGIGRWNDYYIDIAAFYEYGGDLNQDGDLLDTGETCYPNTSGVIEIAPTEEVQAVVASNPFENKEVIALVEGQKSITNRRIYHSIDVILDRIEWFWRNRRKVNLNHNSIKINLESSLIDEIKNLPINSVFDLQNIFSIEMGQIIDLNAFGQIFGDQWATWSTGEITMGKSDETSASYMNDFKSDNITIGFDKKINKNSLFGFALRKGYDFSKLGTLGTNLKTNDFGLTFYFSEHLEKNSNFKYILGLNKLDLNSNRIYENKFQVGNRNAYQIYQSVSYEIRKNIKNNYFSKYAKIDVGYSELRPYKENYSDLALGFNELKIRTLKGFLGLRYDREVILKSGRFHPFANFEFGLDLTTNTNESAYYLANPTLINFYSPKQNDVDTYKFGLGFDFNFYTGSVGALIETYRENNEVNFRSNKIRLKALFFF